MFAVCVTFTTAPEFTDAFRGLMAQNAATSVAEEDACSLFDVCEDPAQPNVFFLYEIYTDAAAFDVHLASSHFKIFNAVTEKMVVGKEVKTFQNVTTARA